MKKWLRLEGTSGASSCPTALLEQSQLELAAQDHRLLNISTGEDFTMSLGNLCQCFATLIEKGFFACLLVCFLDKCPKHIPW